jgi:hypothetical protein
MARPRCSRKASAPRRLACDTCHSLKEKCDFDHEVDPPSCGRCFRLGKTCVTSRAWQAGGRPRKPLKTPTRPQPGIEFVWQGGRRDPSEAGSTILSSSISTSASKSDVEKSEQGYGADEEADEDEGDNQDGPTPEPNLSSGPLIRSLSDSKVFVDRTPQEAIFIARVFQTNPNFMRCFVIGPSFLQRAQHYLCYGMYAAPEVILPVHLAMRWRWKLQAERAAGRPIAEHKGRDYAYCAKAVEILRRRGRDANAQAHEWLLTLQLGMCIMTFDLIDGGTNAHSIIRSTLGMLVKHLARARKPVGSPGFTAAVARLEQGLFPLVFFDTWNSVVRRELPVFRFEPQSPGVVDSYLGLCGELLPHLYDICVLSRDVCTRDIEADGSILTDDLEERYQTLRETVLAWTPKMPDASKGELGRFGSEETQLLCTQVEIYRRVSLLVLHRIRYPFGDEHDGEAAQLARSILAEISCIYGNANDAMMRLTPEVPGSRLPPAATGYEYRLVPAFIVAVVELLGADEREDAMRRLFPVVVKQMYVTLCQFMKGFIAAVWDARDQGFKGHWFDLAQGRNTLVLF